MFETHKEWEMPFPAILGPEGTTVYRATRMMFHTFHFIVEFTVPVDEEEDGATLGQIVLFSSINDVLQAVSPLQNFKISLFVPRYKNKDGEFSISTISEIIEGREEGQPAHIFKCKNGNTYVDSKLGNTAEQLKDKKTAYLAKEA